MEEVRPPLREGMTWRGILRDDQLDRLKDLFGDDVIVPGLTGRFGSSADADGRLYIPGAAHGFNDTKRTLQGWRERGRGEEKYNWWPHEMREKGYEAVTGRDVIEGVSMERWKAYSRRYKSRVEARNKKAAKLRKRQRAVEAAQTQLAAAQGAGEAASDQPVEAASDQPVEADQAALTNDGQEAVARQAAAPALNLEPSSSTAFVRVKTPPIEDDDEVSFPPDSAAIFAALDAAAGPSLGRINPRL